jgi:hypothetical protein
VRFTILRGDDRRVVPVKMGERPSHPTRDC